MQQIDETIDRRPILVIDGLNVFMRHMLVNETISSTGEPYGGAVGFLRFLRNTIALLRPKKVVVCWEQGGGASKRKKILPEYKQNRAKVATGKSNYMNELENKIVQLQFLSNIMTHLPVLQLYVPDVEGDDVVAFVAKYPFKEEKTVIVSSDTDLHQLLGENLTTVIYNPASKTFVNGTDVLNKVGVHPKNFCLAKAIVGDKSDNIPGINGVGFGRLVSLFPELSEDKDIDVSSMIKLVKERTQQTKKPSKTLTTLSETIEEVLPRNWKLMYLDTNILGGDQVKKILARVDEFEPTINSIEFMRCFAAANLSLDHSMMEGLADYKALIQYAAKAKNNQ